MKRLRGLRSSNRLLMAFTAPSYPGVPSGMAALGAVLLTTPLSARQGLRGESKAWSAAIL